MDSKLGFNESDFPSSGFTPETSTWIPFDISNVEALLLKVADNFGCYILKYAPDLFGIVTKCWSYDSPWIHIFFNNFAISGGDLNDCNHSRT